MNSLWLAFCVLCGCIYGIDVTLSQLWRNYFNKFDDEEERRPRSTVEQFGRSAVLSSFFQGLCMGMVSGAFFAVLYAVFERETDLAAFPLVQAALRGFIVLSFGFPVVMQVGGMLNAWRWGWGVNGMVEAVVEAIHDYGLVSVVVMGVTGGVGAALGTVYVLVME